MNDDIPRGLGSTNVDFGTHTCVFKVMRGTIKGDTWLERCFCGKTCRVSVSRSDNENKAGAMMTKRWYDADGNLERVSGNGKA